MSRPAVAHFSEDEYKALKLLERRAIRANDPSLLEQIESVRLEYLQDVSSHEPDCQSEGINSLKFALWLVEQLNNHKIEKSFAKMALRAALFESEANGIDGSVLNTIRQTVKILPLRAHEMDYWAELRVTLHGLLKGLGKPKLAYDEAQVQRAL